MQSEKTTAQKVMFGRCAGRSACSGHEIMIRFALLRLKHVDLLAPLRALTPGGLLGLGDIIGALSLGCQGQGSSVTCAKCARGFVPPIGVHSACHTHLPRLLLRAFLGFAPSHNAGLIGF